MGKIFGVVSRDECKSATSDFSEMGEGRFMIIPKFIRGLTVVGRGAGEVG